MRPSEDSEEDDIKPEVQELKRSQKMRLRVSSRRDDREIHT